MWYMMDHLGTSWYILVHPIRRGMKQKAATGAELRASSPTSPTTGAMNSSTFWKHLHQTAYSTLAASSTKMNQCLHALHGCIVLLTFAICLCICQSIFTVSVEPRNALWSFCQLALLLRNAGRNQPVQAPQPTQGPGGPGAFEFLFGKLWHLV